MELTSAPLRKKWLSWPLPPEFNTITQVWNAVSSAGHHAGVDIACPVGTPLYALTSGTVIETQSQWDDKAGNFLWVKVPTPVDRPRSWDFQHLSQIFVKPGDTVTKGQLVGYSGATGNVTGPHLHVGCIESVTNMGSYANNSLTWDPIKYVLTVPPTNS